jgi:hypothetical protein
LLYNPSFSDLRMILRLLPEKGGVFMKLISMGGGAPLLLLFLFGPAAPANNLVPPTEVPSAKVGRYPQEVAEKLMKTRR